MPREGSDSPPECGRADRRFGPERRLRRRKDFARVLAGGLRLHARVVTVVVRPNGTEHPRLGLAVARRALPRAVDRHRLKRRIRESFRHHAERLRGLDVVVLANPGVRTMGARSFTGLLERQWERAARAAGAERRGEATEPS